MVLESAREIPSSRGEAALAIGLCSRYGHAVAGKLLPHEVPCELSGVGNKTSFHLPVQSVRVQFRYLFEAIEETLAIWTCNDVKIAGKSTETSHEFCCWIECRAFIRQKNAPFLANSQ
jgi:hypothetical protein